MVAGFITAPVNATPEPSRVDQDTPLTQRTARVLLWIEKYPLPLVYFWLAWRCWEVARATYLEHRAAALSPLGLPPGWQNLYYAALGRYSLLLALMAFTGVTLLLNRAPSTPPDKLKHVVVPLAASFYFVLYTLVDKLPPAWSENLAPLEWRPTLTLAGIAFSLVGYAVAIWALCYLRRSFALMVAVRRVVFGGPYAYVRHPMYLGYLLDTVGLLLVTGSLGMGLLAAGFVALMTIRARMEEENLAGASAEYKRHYWRTGLFFPRWPRLSGR